MMIDADFVWEPNRRWSSWTLMSLHFVVAVADDEDTVEEQRMVDSLMSTAAAAEEFVEEFEAESAVEQVNVDSVAAE